MTKLIIFDLGKVLIDFDFKIAITKLRARVDLDMLKMFALFYGSTLAKEWDQGLIEPPEFFEKIQDEMNFPLEMADFCLYWNEIFTEKQEMVELAQSLKQSYKVALLSNTNRWHADYLKEHFPWVLGFDAFIASCDVKMLKPDPKIYKLVLEKMKTPAEEAFYVDDIRENVDAARKLGIDAVVFKGAKQFVEDLEKRKIRHGLTEKALSVIKRS